MSAILPVWTLLLKYCRTAFILDGELRCRIYGIGSDPRLRELIDTIGIGDAPASSSRRPAAADG